MSGRARRIFYCFISNKNNEYYSCDYTPMGEPVITASASPVPLKYNPTNIEGMQPEFATNKLYFSLHRSITNPFQFIRDGASILRELDYNGNGFEQQAVFTIVKYNPDRGIYELYYTGKFDFSKKRDNPLTGYTINTVDVGVWGVLSQRDDVPVRIPCSALNPKAIKILFDGTTIKAKYFYQTVGNTAMDLSGYGGYLILPFVLTNTDGDSFGIISQSQEYDFFNHNDKMIDYARNHPAVFFFKTQYATHIDIQGDLKFDLTSHNITAFSIWFSYWRSTDTVDNIWDLPDDRKLFYRYYRGLNGIHTTIAFSANASFDLAEGEYVMLICRVHVESLFGDQAMPFLTPSTTDVSVSTNTKIIATTAYAIRPLDLAQQIVAKATNGLFTVDSNYYKTNNKVVCTCGDALRGEPLAEIQTTFRDWFKSYDSGDFLAARILNGALWIEEANTVYDENGEILDLGEINDIEIDQATDHLLSNLEIGSPRQDYRRSNGRFEFNAPTKFSFEVSTVKNALDLVSRYRRDGYGAEFLRLDYFAGNTQDNKGDKEVFMIDISDELGEATTYISNYKIYQVNNVPLTPKITSPVDNDTITFQKPTIKGNAPAGQTVNIYVDSVFDGSVVADANNTWIYEIQTLLDELDFAGNMTIRSGIHKVEATFTDLTGTSDSVVFTVTSGITAISVLYPPNVDNIVDNKPLIKGRGQAGQILNIRVGPYDLGNVTVDNSGWWEIQSPVLIYGGHILQVLEAGVLKLQIAFNTYQYTAIPIITRPSEQFELINNLPLVEGVAAPGTIVFIYLDYYNIPLGTATADANGNWSIQVVPMLQSDGVTVLTPIPNGEHTLSTGLNLQNTPIQTTGYKLNRPNFDSITGVYDNSVYNVMLSPKRMLLKRASYWASLMLQNQNTSIQYDGNDKNQGLATLLNDTAVVENADVPISILGKNLFTPIKATFKTKVPNTFNQVFNFFNHGGNIRATFQGNEIWFIPIGRMNVNDVVNNYQTWNLLFAAKTPLTTILNLYRQGLTLNLMTNALYHSDYNSLHFVKYDFQLDTQYHAKEMYDDWFNERSDRWIHNPPYIQKFQTNETIRDQVITNGVSALTLNMYRCRDAVLVSTFVYNPVSPSPIPPPDLVREAIIDFALYPPDQYFFVMMIGSTPVCISERVESRVDWPDTILIAATKLTNLTGFMYSTGIVSKLRVEGLVTKWQPSVSIISNTDEIGDNQMLHSVFSRHRRILIGNASGLPDYLYLKAAAFVILDTLMIENVNYVASKENKLQEQDRIAGHPLYHYELDVELANNNLGVVFPAAPGADLHSVVITVDAEAFGAGGSQLVDITLEGE
jgi:hypothetical protein